MIAIQEASLQYGTHSYPIPMHDLTNVAPFEYSDPEESALLAMAVLSNLSGGHLLRGGVVAFNPQAGYARCIGNGFAIRWGVFPRRGEGESVDDFIARASVLREQEVRVVLKFDVSSDQYGEGWKRARRHPASHADFLMEERALSKVLAPVAA